jgi:hypothetical protein
MPVTVHIADRINGLGVNRHDQCLGPGHATAVDPVAAAPGRVQVWFWLGAKLGLGVVFWLVLVEGLRVVIPPLGWKFYRAVHPLYYLPLGRKLDMALVVAFGMMAVVLWMWHKMLQQVLGVDATSDAKKWYRDGEKVFRTVLGAALLLCDAGVFYLGICGLAWGGSRLSVSAVLATLSYVCVMIGVTYAAIDASRARRHLIKAAPLVFLVACLPLAGCTPTDQSVFVERQSEYVLTILLDLSPSFARQLVDGGASNFMEAVLDTYFHHRAGSSDDLIVIAKISGDREALLWQGTPHDLREQFPSPANLREFLLNNRDSSGSRVHEAIVDTLRHILTDPNVASGGAKSALFVLSDMVENAADAKATEEDVTRLLSEYGTRDGVVGLYFVKQGLVPVWRERLAESGVRFAVSSEIDRNPPLPCFE